MTVVSSLAEREREREIAVVARINASPLKSSAKIESEIIAKTNSKVATRESQKEFFRLKSESVVDRTS